MVWVVVTEPVPDWDPVLLGVDVDVDDIVDVTELVPDCD